MSDVRTPCLHLHPVDVAEGERIVAGTAGPADAWADDFPSEGDVRAVGAFLHNSAAHGEQRPFGYYRITRLADGRAVGGIGFKGRPEGGCVQIGYGVAPSARGHGYAAEAVLALVAIAAERGLVKVMADTTLDNIASQRTLVRAGFRLVGSDDGFHYYEAILDGGRQSPDPDRLPVMVRTRMHADEVATDPRSVRRLLRRQFPQWATLPVSLVESYGTDHDIYRLGEHLAVRLPRIGGARDQASKEARWLPGFAAQLPLALPVPVALGEPDEGYPFPWGVYEWLPGEPAHGAVLRDLDEAAGDLAAFIAALHGIDTTGAPVRSPGSRGGPLVERDGAVRRCIAELGDRIDGAAALRCWESSLSAPTWKGRDVWIHGDLLPGNLLAVHGRLSAVIDFGTLTVGDPACDLLPAWNMFDGSSRRTFLDEVHVDEASRLRGRGWVLSQALVALPYYWTTNPPMVRQALHAVAHVLADADGGT